MKFEGEIYFIENADDVFKIYQKFNLIFEENIIKTLESD